MGDYGPCKLLKRSITRGPKAKGICDKDEPMHGGKLRPGEYEPTDEALRACRVCETKGHPTWANRSVRKGGLRLRGSVHPTRWTMEHFLPNTLLDDLATPLTPVDQRKDPRTHPMLMPYHKWEVLKYH